MVLENDIFCKPACRTRTENMAFRVPLESRQDTYFKVIMISGLDQNNCFVQQRCKKFIVISIPTRSNLIRNRKFADPPPIVKNVNLEPEKVLSELSSGLFVPLKTAQNGSFNKIYKYARRGYYRACHDLSKYGRFVY